MGIDMTVTGRFKRDQYDEIVLFSNGVMYILNTVPYEEGLFTWGSIIIGGRSATNHVLTRETYDRYESECTETGTFWLTDTNWERVA